MVAAPLFATLNGMSLNMQSQAQLLRLFCWCTKLAAESSRSVSAHAHITKEIRTRMRRLQSVRVLQLSAAYPPNQGGVATHVANLAQGLVRREGFQVFILTSTEGTDRNTEKDYKNGPLVVWKRPIIPIPNYSGRRAPYGDLLEFMLERWSEIRPDVIHAHDFDGVQLGCMLKAAFRVPLIATIHRAPNPWRDIKYAENSKDCYLEAMRRYRFADALVVPSRASRQVLVDQGFKTSRVKTIPHGVRTKYLASFTNHPRLLELVGIPSDATLILCPVRADSHKDPWTFVRAASLLHRRASGRLVFLMTCNNTEDEYRGLAALASSGGLVIGRDIIFCSFERGHMATLYRRASVCVVPSRRESFGQTVLEAFVYGVPVVAANTSSLREIVVNRRNGLLFTDGSHDELATQVERILSSGELAATLRMDGLKCVQTKYEAETMIDRYERLYRSIYRRR